MALVLVVGCGDDNSKTDDLDTGATGTPTAGDDDDDDGPVGDDDDDDDGTITPEEFGYQFAEKYCDEYETCNTSGEPCFTDTTTTGGTTTGGTTTYECDFDPVAAQACLDGEWTCIDNYPGFEFVMPPEACMAVCG